MQTLIAIPALNWIYTEFLDCMLRLDKPNAHYAIQKNTLIHDARSNLAWGAVQNGYDRVLWLDSDMIFEPDLLVRLNADMDDNGLDCVSAYYVERRMEPQPCIYSQLIWERSEDGEIRRGSQVIPECPDGLFEIAGMGFGACLMKTEMIKAVYEAFGAPFQPLPYMGEDMSFCIRARQLGWKLWCDGRIHVGHIGTHIYREAGEHV